MLAILPAMYLMTYVGRWMNGLTVVVGLWCALFSLPKIYRDNKTQIDEAVAPIKVKMEEAMTKLRASMPAAPAAAVSVAKKEE